VNPRNTTPSQGTPADQNDFENYSGSEWQAASRLGILPSVNLRRHFVALARQVKQWAITRGRPIKVGVTSLERKVGKSTIAFNLAASLSRVERDQVLLVEADFGKHFISRRLGSAGTSGLSDILLGQATASECIQRTPIDRLAVLGSGHINEVESVELPFDTMGTVLDQYCERFGYMIFDLPVASELTSCYSILPSIDGVIVVVEANKIDRRHVIRVKNRLTSCGVDILGMVINRA
jgi:capsular exopolysaccharide synthesis family protein